MKIIYERKTIIATTDNERDFLSVMFNQQLIRGAFIYWSNKHPVTPLSPPEWVKRHNATAYLMLTELEDSSMTINTFKETDETKQQKVDDANKKLAGDLFSKMGM